MAVIRIGDTCYELVDEKHNNIVDIEDLKLALAGWFCNEDSEWTGEGDAFDDPDLKQIMKKYGLSRQDILSAAQKEWLT